MNSMKCSLQHLLRGFAVVLLVAGVALPAAAEQARKKVRTGEVAPIALFWPGMVAQKQKFYEREGLDVEQNFVGTVGGIVQQVIAGSLDFGFTTAETAMRAVDKGAD